MTSQKHDAQSAKQAWVTPAVTELPGLTNLTLQSGGGPVISDPTISGAISGSGDASTGTFSF